MPKNKKIAASSNVTSTEKTAPKAADPGKEVKAEQPTPPPPVSSPTSPASGEAAPAFFVVKSLKTSPLKAADLLPGMKVTLVKCVQSTPEGHFPFVDRTKVTDAAVEATFLNFEDMHFNGATGSGVTLDGSIEDNEKVKAALPIKKVAIFDDGRAKFATPYFSTVSADDIGMLVYPTDDEGVAAAVDMADFISARAFHLGWSKVIRDIQRNMLVRSANVSELLAWLDKQGLGTLRAAAAVYGLNVKSTFAKEVDLAKAREIVKAARVAITDKAVLDKMAKEYTELRIEWEQEKKNLSEHPTVARWIERLKSENAPSLNLSLARCPFEDDEVKAAEAKKKADKAAQQTPRDTAIGGASTQKKGKALSIDEMRKLIAIADAEAKAKADAEAKAAQEYAAKAAADKAKREIAEAEARKAAASVKVTDNKAQAAATSKVKTKKAKLAASKTVDPRERDCTSLPLGRP